MSDIPKVTIYTDGSVEPNPGRGGWAAVIIEDGRERVLSGSSPHATNNQMEMTAALEALKDLNQSSKVKLYTDSQYLINGITQWIKGWKRKNWKNSLGEPVKNADLWRALDDATKFHQVEWIWVKGHVDVNNIRVDQLALQARCGGGTSRAISQEIVSEEREIDNYFLTRLQNLLEEVKKATPVNKCPRQNRYKMVIGDLAYTIENFTK